METNCEYQDLMETIPHVRSVKECQISCLNDTREENICNFTSVWCTGWGVCSFTANMGYCKADVKDRSNWYKYHLNIYMKYIFAQNYLALSSHKLFITVWPQSISIPCNGDIKKILLTFKHRIKIHHFLKLQGFGSRIEPAMPFSILCFEISKWVWQAHFLSNTSVILWNPVFFVDVEMILLIFIDVLTKIQ